MTLDWREPDDYGYCKNLTPAGWAFEFLRRNPLYRADYAAYRKIEDTLTQEYGPYAAAKNKWRSDARAWVCELAPLPGETIRELTKRYFKSDLAKFSAPVWYEEWYAQKWGLNGVLRDPDAPAYPDPAFVLLAHGWPRFPQWPDVGDFFGDPPGDTDDDISDEPPAWLAEKYPGMRWIGSTPGGDTFDPLPGYAVIVFKLELPIEDQMVAARDFLLKKRASINEANLIKKKKSPGNASVLFLRYLRVLDAKRAGETDAAIGKIIFQKDAADPTKKVGDVVAAAEDYIRRYLSVALMAL